MAPAPSLWTWSSAIAAVAAGLIASQSSGIRWFAPIGVALAGLVLLTGASRAQARYRNGLQVVARCGACHRLNPEFAHRCACGHLL